MEQNLIQVVQLPIIKEQLRVLSAEIDRKVEDAKALVCTEDTVKSVKAVRADLNTQFKALEDVRGQVKKQVMAPYLEFEALYKKCVTDKFSGADRELKSKIDDVEGAVKLEKSKDVILYFSEYAASKHIDFLKFSDSKINVTLTASPKSLKAQAKEFVDRVAADVEMIATQEFPDEMMVEYRGNGYDAAKAVTCVVGRHRQMEAQKEAAEARAKVMEQERADGRRTISVVPDAFVPAPAPAKHPSDVLTLSFRVTATRSKLIALRAFMDADSAYQYE